MFSFFLFGTLQDADLREIVLGIPKADHRVQKSILHGYCLTRLRSRVQPGLIAEREGQVKGLLVCDLDVVAAARMSHYEYGAYDVELVSVEAVDRYRSAWIFRQNPHLVVTSGQWSLHRWQQKYKRRSLSVANTWMSQLYDSKLDSLKIQWLDR